jgi:hypothetical protein
MDDKEIQHTVESILKNADSPNLVFVGIGLTAKKNETFKIVKGLSKKYSNVRYLFVKQKTNDLSTLGVGRGRYLAQSLYKNEDYFMQVDSHSYFEKSWDSRLISLFEDAIKEVGDNRVVLTCIPPRYIYDKNENPQKIEPFTRYPMFDKGFFVEVVPAWRSEDSLQLSSKKIIPSLKANSAFMFGNSEFAKNTGISPTSIFYDEEIIYSINLFGNGFALAFPNTKDFPVMHLDGDAIIKGHERSFFLDYLSKKNKLKIHENLKENYLSFINNLKNKEKIEKYKKYAKVDPKRGYYSVGSESIPTSFR